MRKKVLAVIAVILVVTGVAILFLGFVTKTKPTDNCSSVGFVFE